MVSDAPYEFEGLLLPVGVGALAGGIAALLMLGLIQGLEPITQVSPSMYLARAGSVLGPLLPADQRARVLSGLGLHFAVGGLLGTLYAASQRPVPTRGLIGVGVFYGFVLWVAGGVLIGWMFNDALHAILRSSVWLFSCLLFGVGLAVTSIIWKAWHPAQSSVLPKD